MYEVRFLVEGAGEFPVDMLRYDGCYPLNESDSARLVNRRSDRREVMLGSVVRDRMWSPTEGRWESFGWKVVGVKAIIDL